VPDRVGNKAEVTNPNKAKVDLGPPTALIDDPGTNLRGLVNLTSTVADSESGVGTVVYQRRVTGGSTWTAIPATWDTTTAPDGLYDLRVVVTDMAGNITASDPVSSRRVDNTAPTGSVTAPGAGDIVSGAITVTSADVADAGSGLASVEFQVKPVDGAFSTLGTDTTSPYLASWNTASGYPDGAYVLRAIFTDVAGNTRTSDEVNVTVSNALDTTHAFKKVVVGPGLVDASVRQVVRTSTDRVYIFAADDTAQKQGTGPGVIRAWRADQAGIPTSFAEVDGASRPTSTGTDVLGSPDVRLAPNNIAHLVYVNKANAELVYRTFSTTTPQAANTWGMSEVIAAGVAIGSHPFKRAETANALVLDQNDVPHVVYTAGSSVLYRNRVGGVWSAPETIATGSLPIHPQLAADANGSLHLTWLEQGAFPAIRYAKRSAGSWSSAETVASTDVLTNDNLDQGPSIVLTQSGVPYVMYVSALPGSAVRVKYKLVGGWIFDSTPADFFVHTPQIYARQNDIYAFLGHDSDINIAYAFHPAGGAPWSGLLKLSDGEDDGSASIRWDPMRENNSAIIDAAFFNENYTGSNFLPQLFYFAIVPDVLAGQPSVLPNLNSNPAGQAEAFRTRAEASGTLRKLSLYLDSASSSTSAVVGIYSDTGGHPGTLLGAGVVNSPVNGGWNTVAVPATAVSAGTNYWIAVLAPTGAGSVRFRDAGGAGTAAETSLQTNLTALPSTWATGGTFAEGPLSAYGRG
jgi:hypothetical protein